MSRLSKDDLLAEVLQAVRDAGWQALVLGPGHPFLVRVTNPERSSFDMRVYIWNCTHGGGGRAADEYRIQVTGVVPTIQAGEQTLLLGWHDAKRVFAAWDIRAHSGQASSSPSAQIRESSLDSAHDQAFSIQRKDNEIVVAFRPQFLVEYALASASFHLTGSAHNDMELLNRLKDLTDTEIDAVRDTSRRKVIRTIATTYRAYDFRERVLGAYGHRCAFCRVQLSLLDAAHIVPVAAPGSTDEIVNGIALCKLHHFAYDSNLVSFDWRYRIEVSQARLAELSAMNVDGGLKKFRAALAPTLALPTQVRHHPNKSYIRMARGIRGWRA